MADQSRSVERGGIVKGVPCAVPKCVVLQWMSRRVISSGSVIHDHEVACLGGVSSVGISSLVTRV